MKLTDEMLERIARKVCADRGIDPDEIIPDSSKGQFTVVDQTSVTFTPQTCKRWTQVINQIRLIAEVLLAMDEVCKEI